MKRFSLITYVYYEFWLIKFQFGTDPVDFRTPPDVRQLRPQRLHRRREAKLQGNWGGLIQADQCSAPSMELSFLIFLLEDAKFLPCPVEPWVLLFNLQMDKGPTFETGCFGL